MSKEILVKAIQDSGFDPIAYSGRFMYGESCIGFKCENPMCAILDLIQACDNENTEELCDVLRTAKTDQLGYDCVLYFEDIKFES